jgi:hypothetical protein
LRYASRLVIRDGRAAVPSPTVEIRREDKPERVVALVGRVERSGLKFLVGADSTPHASLVHGLVVEHRKGGETRRHQGATARWRLTSIGARHYCFFVSWKLVRSILIASGAGNFLGLPVSAGDR